MDGIMYALQCSKENKRLLEVKQADAGEVRDDLQHIANQSRITCC